MRRLILMRHAKSSWKSSAATDHERPLSKRGRRDAPAAARHLVECGWEPQLVVASDSARTRETWARMEDHLPEARLITTRMLYHAGLRDLVAHAERWSDDAGVVLALGHNPGWEDALERLTGTPQRMTTGNVALLEGHGATWAAALDGPWRLVDLFRPRRPKGA